jgi:hypothetical protein
MGKGLYWRGRYPRKCNALRRLFAGVGFTVDKMYRRAIIILTSGFLLFEIQVHNNNSTGCSSMVSLCDALCRELVVHDIFDY